MIYIFKFIQIHYSYTYIYIDIIISNSDEIKEHIFFLLKPLEEREYTSYQDFVAKITNLSSSNHIHATNIFQFY